MVPALAPARSPCACLPRRSLQVPPTPATQAAIPASPVSQAPAALPLPVAIATPAPHLAPFSATSQPTAAIATSPAATIPRAQPPAA